MTKQEFQRKIKAVYADLRPQFDHNEVQNAAYLKGYLFYNNVHSDQVHIQANGRFLGRAYGVENA